MTVSPVVARSDDKIRVGVAVELWNTAAGSITGIKGPVDVDFQAIPFRKRKKNVGPVRS